jgi:5'-3' exonuclease
MLIGFFNQVIQFLSNGLVPLYIFDGGTIQEKEKTNQNRNHKKQVNKAKLELLDAKINDFIDLETEITNIRKKIVKNTIRISINEINILLELFDILNIPYIFSYGEGEYLAVLLNEYSIIDMFLTDDTDPLPAGIIRTIKFFNNGVYYLENKTILDKLKMDSKQFCDFCIMLGSDYAIFNHGFKPPEILKMIQEEKCIENILESHHELKTSVKIEIVNKIRKVYSQSALNERTMFINPDSEKMHNYNFIIDHNNYNFYSNIMLEFWDDFIFILKQESNCLNLEFSINFKNKINKYIRLKKFNIKNIIRFLKNNIEDITEQELKNSLTTFEYLNTFGF